MIKAEILGDDKVWAYLGELKDGVARRVNETVGAYTLRLSRMAQSKAAGGEVKTKSGKLLAAIKAGTTFAVLPGRARGRVGLGGASREVAIYGASQEYGADLPAKIIEAKNQAALRFQIDGQFYFAKRVSVPAFSLPERSYLRSSLREIGPEFAAACGRAIGIRD